MGWTYKCNYLSKSLTKFLTFPQCSYFSMKRTSVLTFSATWTGGYRVSSLISGYVRCSEPWRWPAKPIFHQKSSLVNLVIVVYIGFSRKSGFNLLLRWWWLLFVFFEDSPARVNTFVCPLVKAIYFANLKMEEYKIQVRQFPSNSCKGARCRLGSQNRLSSLNSSILLKSFVRIHSMSPNVC